MLLGSDEFNVHRVFRLLRAKTETDLLRYCVTWPNNWLPLAVPVDVQWHGAKGGCAVTSHVHSSRAPTTLIRARGANVRKIPLIGFCLIGI